MKMNLIVSTKGCNILHPKFCSLDSQKKTFDLWPSNSQVSPNDLSKCGFFYVGSGDRVLYFYCGVGLEKWVQTDNPWVEHAINSHRCPYLLLSRGEATATKSLMEEIYVSNRNKKCIVIYCTKFKALKIFLQIELSSTLMIPSFEDQGIAVADCDKSDITATETAKF